MSKTAVVVCSTKVDGDTILLSQSITAGEAILIDEAVPKNSTSLGIALAFATAKLKVMQLIALGAALTVVFTYASGAGTITITLAVGQGFFYALGTGGVNPFAHDVISAAVTEGNIADATLQGKLLVDLS